MDTKDPVAEAASQYTHIDANTKKDERAFIRAARRVFVPINGIDDVFYIAISKVNARLLLKESNGQLGVSMLTSTSGAGDVYIERRDRKHR